MNDIPSGSRTQAQLHEDYLRIEEALGPIEEDLGLAFRTFNSQKKAAVIAAERAQQISPPAYGQIPHIDLTTGEVQIAVALTSSSPTLIYQGIQDYPLAHLAAEVGIPTWDLADMPEAAMRQLLLPHSVLIADLKPACEGCMAEGDLIAMCGGVVHARPAM